MEGVGTFLSVAEFAEFQRPSRFRARHVLRTKGRKLSLEEYCTEILKLPHPPAFTARVIAVQPDDGMSWSAERVLQMATAVRGSFACTGLTRTSHGQLPALAALLGEPELLKLAARCRLTNRFIAPFLSRLLYLAVLAGAVAAEFSRLYKLPASAWIAATLIAVGIVIKDPLSAWLSKMRLEKSRTTFVESMNTCDVSMQTWKRLVDLAAKALHSGPFPRFVVIDGFDSLDPLTQNVILRYFDQLRDDPIGCEIWCIFDSTTGTTFSAQACLCTNRSSTFASVEYARQLVLSSEEKAELIESLGLPAEQAKFSAVKSVCDLSSLVAKDRTKALREYLHSTSAKPADVASFVGLIGVAALDGRRELRRQSLMSLLSRKEGVTAKVLASILPGTKPNKKELIGLMDILARRELSSLVEVPADGNTIIVEPESAHALMASAADLGLDKLGLCHIYWAIATYHDLQGLSNRYALRSWNLRPLVAYLGCIPSNAMGGQDPEVIAELLDTLRFATEKALQTCLFAEFPALIRKVAELLEYEPLADQQEKRLDRAMKTAWRAFALLGDDKILSTVERLNEQLHPAPDATTEAERTGASHLQNLFLASLPNSYATTWLRGKILAAELGGPNASTSIQLYCRARAAWLAMTFLPIHDEVCGTEMFDCVAEATRDLDDMTASSILLMEKVETISLTDAIGLGMLLWCQALRWSHQEEDQGASPGPGSRLLEEVLSGVRIHPVLAPVQVRTMLALAEKTIALATRLQPADFANVEDFPLAAVTYDLSATALSAALMVSHPYLSEDLDAQDNSLVSAMLTLLARLREAFGEDATVRPLPTSLRGLLGEVESLGTISRLAWRRMNLPYLEEFTLVRKLQFEATLWPATVENMKDHRVQMSGFAALDDRSFLGILENAALAVALVKVRELAAPYFDAMAELAQTARFGADFSFDLSYLLVRACHLSLSEERLQHHMRRLLEPDQNGEPSFYAVLRRLPEPHIPAVMVFLRSATRDSDTPGLLMALAAYADRIASREVREEVAAFLDSIEIHKKLREGSPVEVEDLLLRWAGRTGTRFYPGVLTSLIRYHRSNESLKNAGIACIQQRPSPLLDTWSGWANLALALCEVLKASDPRLPLALEYLRDGVDHWATVLPAGRNIQAYAMLEKHDTRNREQYHDKVMQWLIVKFQRDHDHLVPLLVRQGNYFLLFQEFCFSAAFWKLPISGPEQWVWQRDSDEEGLAELQRWKTAHGDQAPAPMTDQFLASVDTRFLNLGRALFSSPADRQEQFDDLRAAFDREAKRALPKLITTIVNLPELPASIRKLMHQYSSHVIATRPEAVAEQVQ